MISIDLLLKQSLFQGLDRDKLLAICPQVRLQDFAKGEFLFHRGMQGDSLVLLIAGRLQVISYSESGKEVGINFIEPGQYLGEISLIDGEPRSASVVCVSQATVGFLNKATALQLFHYEPLIAARIQKKLCSVIRKEVHHRSKFSSASAYERIYAVLCNHPRVSEGNEPITVDDLPHQRVIASMANVTRETVNRAMKALVEQGVIEKQGRCVRICKPTVLRSLAEHSSSLGQKGQEALHGVASRRQGESTAPGEELVVRRYDRPKTID